jgi:hypothetical protein
LAVCPIKINIRFNSSTRFENSINQIFNRAVEFLSMVKNYKFSRVMIVERLKFGIAGFFALFAKQDKEKRFGPFFKIW